MQVVVVQQRVVVQLDKDHLLFLTLSLPLEVVAVVVMMIHLEILHPKVVLLVVLLMVDLLLV